MKDARGHGSDGRPSNAEAAQSLMSTLKSTMVSIHPAMQDRFSGDNADYTTAENAPLRKTP